MAPGPAEAESSAGSGGEGAPSPQPGWLFGAINKGAGIHFFFPGMSAWGPGIYTYTNWWGKWERICLKKKKKSVEDSCSVLAALSLHIFLFMRFCLSDLSMF